jgi:hypothetical protein
LERENLSLVPAEEIADAIAFAPRYSRRAPIPPPPRA